MSAGFYKVIDGQLIQALLLVKCSQYELKIENKDQYEYPVMGWHYFDSINEAINFFDDEIQDTELEDGID